MVVGDGAEAGTLKSSLSAKCQEKFISVMHCDIPLLTVESVCVSICIFQ